MAISRHLLCFLACFVAVLPAPTLAETITVGGVGSLTPMIKLLGAEYAKKHSGVEVNVIEPPMGSNGGIRAMTAGKIDIAASGRSTNPDEAGVAKPWLQTPLVLATLSGKSKGLTRAQIADIYAGRKANWDDNKPIRLVLRGDKETETKVLRSLSPEIDAGVTEALKRPGLPVAENDLDALELLGKISGSLGTSNLGLIKASGAKLTSLPIDGIMPSAKAMEDGSYPWKRQFYLITQATPRAEVAAFVAWLNSTPALATARKLDYLPIKP
jgi:phosphate transport system substrate-binding protein